MTEQDCVSAQYLHMRPRRILAVLGAVILVGIVVAFVVHPSFIGAGFIAYFVILFFVLIPWGGRRSFRRNKAAFDYVSIEVREDGLSFKGKTNEFLMPWSHIRKWRYNNRVLLVYPVDKVFFPIPRHFFSTSEVYVAFLENLKARTGNAT